jgi:aerobic carbon-monoxide dehydrogenase small subunit
MKLSFLLNRQHVSVDTSPDTSLLDILRQEFQLYGSKDGCRKGSCGACSILMDNRVVYACQIPAFLLLDSKIFTIEGFSKTDDYLDIEKGFLRAGVAPCGFCSAGKIFAAHAILMSNTNPGEEEIKRNVVRVECRCTSFTDLVRGVFYSAAFRRKRINAARR